MIPSNNFEPLKKKKKSVAVAPSEQPNNPLHGVTLKMVLERLVEYYGWEELGEEVNIRCFNWEPSIKSSLKFLRKTQWARDEVEALYVATDFDVSR